MSARCTPCARQSGDGSVGVGRKVLLGDRREYWPCRWCGWPVTGAEAVIDMYNPRRPARRGEREALAEFHDRCQETFFYGAVLSWLLIGCVQLVLGMVGTVVVWWYFSLPSATEAAAAAVPTVVGSVMAGACLYLLAKRYTSTHTYLWTLALELGILLSWVSSWSFSPHPRRDCPILTNGRSHIRSTQCICWPSTSSTATRPAQAWRPWSWWPSTWSSGSSMYWATYFF